MNSKEHRHKTMANEENRDDDDHGIDADVPLATSASTSSIPDISCEPPPDLAAFLGSFFKAKGATQVLFIALLLSFSFSSTVGVVSRWLKSGTQIMAHEETNTRL